MKITRQEARRIADLAHLEFDDAALERMAAEMTKILSYIDQLSEVDVGVGTGFSGSGPAEAGPHTPLREDEPHAGVAREDVQRNAPAWRDGFFVIPRVIGE
jgi:aspartyl-tRNA(Asn)/glutamyl-tRNA(Gln) amidotransferase subunit C